MIHLNIKMLRIKKGWILLGTVLFCLPALYNCEDNCFCQLVGDLGDCSCDVESLDAFNNYNVYPLLSRILEKDYFRFYKVNMFRPCLFDTGAAGRCGSRSCAVDECRDDQIPAGLRKEQANGSNKYSQEAQEKENCEDEEQNELGVIDPHISAENKEAFEKWQKHDDEQDSFCSLDDMESPDAVYYDLIRNPERFTGYVGASAVNVWKLIYDQNCFKPDQSDFANYISPQKDLCLEKRVFFRMISGFHTSINVDVTANWRFPGKNAWDEGTWGPNVEEFVKRFDPKNTWGEGPKRLKNLYFTYLVEMRALAKAAPYLEQELYYTGDEAQDTEVLQNLKELLKIIKSFPKHFDETKLFQGDFKKLKEDFKVHFHNISRIMDCVGCDKCRLWGKLQITGMGTALKILFSGDTPGPESTLSHADKKADIPFQLTRGEIVSLINAFGRLSKSIHEVDTFRRLIS